MNLDLGGEQIPNKTKKLFIYISVYKKPDFFLLVLKEH